MMWRKICMLLSIVAWCSGNRDQVIDDTTLISAFMIHRHGDRTPTKQSVDYTTDVEAVLEASRPYGFGQLTNVGKRNSYVLGKTIRERYDELLSPEFNNSEIYVRSTDSTRTKMTALLALAAIYPADKNNWSRRINWTPVPYTTVPAKYDFNQAILSCPKLMDGLGNLLMEPSPRMVKYASVYDTMAEVLEMKKLVGSCEPGLIYGIYDALVAQMSLGIPVNKKVLAIFPEIREAAGEAVDIIFGNETYVSLQGGVLLNEFFKYAKLTLSGEDTPSVRIYSAHDVTVYSFMATCQVFPRQGAPKYNSLFSLELRKMKGSDRIVVAAVYQPQPGEDVIYLQIKGCDSYLCDLDTFQQTVSQFLLDENTWRDKCGFTPDLEADESSLN